MRTIAFCLTLLGVVGSVEAARAEGQSANQDPRLSKARQQLNSTRSTHAMRNGCTNYVYGCGYGTMRGYGSVPGYGDAR